MTRVLLGFTQTQILIGRPYWLCAMLVYSLVKHLVYATWVHARALQAKHKVTQMSGPFIIFIKLQHLDTSSYSRSLCFKNEHTSSANQGSVHHLSFF